MHEDHALWLSQGLHAIASALHPPGGVAPCPSGNGHTGSLSESVMGVTAGLMAVAGAINNLAEAVREDRPS